MFNAATSVLPDSPVGGIFTIDVNNTFGDNTSFKHVTSTTNVWNNPTAVSAHVNAGIVYEYYRTKFARNGIDGIGGTIFSMINAPLFAVIFLGMFWKRTTAHGAFTGLLGGFLVALAHHGLTAPEGATTLVKGGWITLIHTYPVEMAQNFWTAIYACASATLLTVSISLVTPQRKTDDELKGLVYSMTPKISERNIVWYKRTNTLALLVLVLFIILSILFW
jgi:SSS family solute:Na+ symporter